MKRGFRQWIHICSLGISFVLFCLLQDRMFGEMVVIEELLQGEELSVGIDGVTLCFSTLALLLGFCINTQVYCLEFFCLFYLHLEKCIPLCHANQCMLSVDFSSTLIMTLQWLF